MFAYHGNFSGGFWMFAKEDVRALVEFFIVKSTQTSSATSFVLSSELPIKPGQSQKLPVYSNTSHLLLHSSSSLFLITQIPRSLKIHSYPPIIFHHPFNKPHR
jgi:hypothetical protein